jgi:hypothetical protein
LIISQSLNIQKIWFEIFWKKCMVLLSRWYWIVLAWLTPNF